METSTVPNHHHDHPGFAGVPGLIAALSMIVGRGEGARLAADLVGLRTGDRLVDIGCGPGVAARHAARTAASVVAVDPAPVMLKVARAADIGRSKVAHREGSAEALPLDTDSATVAWTLASVHHWGDLDVAIAEIRRVLAPGGRFLAIERARDEDATGLASHGWTAAQAFSFADLCRERGFDDVTVEQHPHRHSQAHCVLAR